MYKYLCAIILGILIYILLNQYNSFSVGGQEEGAHCKRPNYIRRKAWTMSGDEINNGCDLGYVCKVDPDIDPRREESSFDGSCQSPQEDKNWDEFNLEQQTILTDLKWDKNSWDDPDTERGTSRILPQLQFKHVLTRPERRKLRENGMSDEFLNKFLMRGEPGAPCNLRSYRGPPCYDGQECEEDGKDGTCPIADECDESRQCPEYLVCVNGKCMSAAGGGGGGGGDAAGPFCSSPDSGDPCAAAGGAAAAGGEMTK